MKNETAPPPPRILLIENNDSFVYLIRRALDAEGFPYELNTPDDGAKALVFIRKQGRHAREPRPGVIVMDLHLSKSDGMEILEEIRGSAAFADLPAVVLSSSVSPEEKSKVAAFRGTCFVPKPQDLDEFSKVGKIIRQMAAAGKASGAVATS